MSKIEVKSFNMDTQEQKDGINSIEKQKLNLRPIEFYEELETLDFDALGKGDRYYLQDFGIYNNELSDDEFMLRLRVAGGRISNENLLDIANIAKEYDLTILITARAGIQLHGLEEHNILEVFKKIDNIGLSSWQTFGDNIRNITTDVFDGIGQYNKIEVYPYIKQMEEYILKIPKYVGMLPRRISTSISGSYGNGASFFASDLYFALAIKDGEYGFNIFMGGKNTQLAQDMDIFIAKEKVVEFFKAFVITFNKYGLRKNRNRTRVFHLLEEIGIDKFKMLMNEEYKEDFLPKGELYLEKVVFNDYEKLNDGKFSFCYHSKFSKIPADELINIANFCIKNNYEIRISTDQQLYIFGLPSASFDITHDNENRTVLACAGSEFCPYSYWNIKDETSYLPLKRIQKHKLLIGFSGCLKGCAKHEHSDIGIVGLRSSMYGYSQKTARIYLGAQYSFGSAVARQIFSAIPLTQLKDVLDVIIDEFENSIYDDFELFCKNILNKFSPEFLALWFLGKVESKINTKLEVGNEIIILKNTFSSLEFTTMLNEKLKDVIKFQSKKLWEN